MNGRSRSSLFLIEQLIVITIFALCSTVCVKIFIGSYLTANDTRDMNRALVAAKNGAECYKAYGDPAKAAAALGGTQPSTAARAGVVYYDSGWNVCASSGASYALRLDELPGDENGALPLLCELSVRKMAGEEIIGFIVAAARAPTGRASAERQDGGAE